MSEVSEIARLTPGQYAQLVQSLGTVPYVTAQTTDLQAGQIIGMQFVLQKLRDGWVIG